MRNKGITLIEALIAMAVLAIAMAAVFYGYIVVANIFTEEMSESDILTEINKPLEQMTSEIRNTLQIVVPASHDITFWYKDLNNNSLRDADETISYSWDETAGGDIIKTEGSSSYIVASGVHDFTLTYNSTADATFVTISITIGKGNKVGTLESSVQCRNL